MARADRDLPRVQRRRRRARTAGARRCRPTPPSRWARWRCSTPRAATRLRVFLLTLAVVDDLGALVVIATVYTKHVVAAPRWLVAIGLFGRARRAALRAGASGAARLSVVVGVALWVAMFKSGIDPVIVGPRGRARDERLPAVARGPRARDRARRARFASSRRPELARSAQLERAVGDLAQRAPPVRAAPVDELRDRAAVRARQRRHPRHRRPARRRDPLADHARASWSATSSASRSASSARRGSPRGRGCTGRARR